MFKKSLFVINKILSWIVLLTFFSTNVSAAPFGQSSLHFDGVKIPSLANDIDIPDSLGSIDKRVASSGPTIIHLQDAHGSYEGQINTKKIIETLKDKYGVDLILLEGGFGKLRPEQIQFFKDRDLAKATADDLAKKGIVGGAELFLLDELLSKQSYSAFGVEDQTLYLENLKSFRGVISQKPQTDQFLNGFKTELVSQSSIVFNHELKSFFRKWLFYQDIKSELMSHLNVLSDYSSKVLKLDFTDARNQLDWPQLVRFFKLKDLEKERDLKKIEEDRQRLISWAHQNGIKNSFTDCLKDLKPSCYFSKGNPYGSVRHFFERFYEAASKKGFKFSDYPDFTKDAGMRILQDELEATKLFGEVETLTDQILGKLTKNKAEEELLSVYRDYLLISKLFSLELTSKEYRLLQMKLDHLKPSSISKRLSLVKEASRKKVRGKENDLAALDRIFKRAVHFYEGTHRREQAIFDHMIQRMKEAKQIKAVLVTGGFHAEGLHELFNQNQLSYVSILPHLSEVPDTKTYLNVMMLGNLPIQKAHIKALLAMQPDIEKAAPDIANFLESEIKTSVLEVASKRGILLDTNVLLNKLSPAGRILFGGVIPELTSVATSSRAEVRKDLGEQIDEEIIQPLLQDEKLDPDMKPYIQELMALEKRFTLKGDQAVIETVVQDERVIALNFNPELYRAFLEGMKTNPDVKNFVFSTILKEAGILRFSRENPSVIQVYNASRDRLIQFGSSPQAGSVQLSEPSPLYRLIRHFVASWVHIEYASQQYLIAFLNAKNFITEGRFEQLANQTGPILRRYFGFKVGFEKFLLASEKEQKLGFLAGYYQAFNLMEPHRQRILQALALLEPQLDDIEKSRGTPFFQPTIPVLEGIFGKRTIKFMDFLIDPNFYAPSIDALPTLRAEVRKNPRDESNEGRRTALQTLRSRAEVRSESNASEPMILPLASLLTGSSLEELSLSSKPMQLDIDASTRREFLQASLVTVFLSALPSFGEERKERKLNQKQIVAWKEILKRNGLKQDLIETVIERPVDQNRLFLIRELAKALVRDADQVRDDLALYSDAASSISKDFGSSMNRFITNIDEDIRIKIQFLDRMNEDFFSLAGALIEHKVELGAWQPILHMASELSDVKEIQIGDVKLRVINGTRTDGKQTNRTGFRLGKIKVAFVDRGFNRSAAKIYRDVMDGKIKIPEGPLKGYLEASALLFKKDLEGMTVEQIAEKMMRGVADNEVLHAFEIAKGIKQDADHEMRSNYNQLAGSDTPFLEIAQIASMILTGGNYGVQAAKTIDALYEEARKRKLIAPQRETKVTLVDSLKQQGVEGALPLLTDRLMAFVSVEKVKRPEVLKMFKEVSKKSVKTPLPALIPNVQMRMPLVNMAAMKFESGVKSELAKVKGVPESLLLKLKQIEFWTSEFMGQTDWVQDGLERILRPAIEKAGSEIGSVRSDQDRRKLLRRTAELLSPRRSEVRTSGDQIGVDLQENRRWPLSNRIMRPLISWGASVLSNFSTAPAIRFSYGGWIWIRMILNSLGGYVAVFVKSLSSVIRILSSFLARRAISRSIEEGSTLATSWFNRLSVWMSLAGTSSSIKNFIQGISGTVRKGSILDSSHTGLLSEEQPVRVPGLTGGSNFYRLFPQVLPRLLGVLRPRILGFGFPGILASRAETRHPPLYVSPKSGPLNSPFGEKPSISEGRRQESLHRAEVRGVSTDNEEVLKKVVPELWTATRQFLEDEELRLLKPTLTIPLHDEETGLVEEIAISVRVPETELDIVNEFLRITLFRQGATYKAEAAVEVRRAGAEPRSEVAIWAEVQTERPEELYSRILPQVKGRPEWAMWFAAARAEVRSDFKSAQELFGKSRVSSLQDRTEIGELAPQAGPRPKNNRLIGNNRLAKIGENLQKVGLGALLRKNVAYTRTEIVWDQTRPYLIRAILILPTNSPTQHIEVLIPDYPQGPPQTPVLIPLEIESLYPAELLALAEGRKGQETLLQQRFQALSEATRTNIRRLVGLYPNKRLPLRNEVTLIGAIEAGILHEIGEGILDVIERNASPNQTDITLQNFARRLINQWSVLYVGNPAVIFLKNTFKELINPEDQLFHNNFSDKFSMYVDPDSIYKDFREKFSQEEKDYFDQVVNFLRMLEKQKGDMFFIPPQTEAVDEAETATKIRELVGSIVDNLPKPNRFHRGPAVKVIVESLLTVTGAFSSTDVNRAFQSKAARLNLTKEQAGKLATELNKKLARAEVRNLDAFPDYISNNTLVYYSYEDSFSVLRQFSAAVKPHGFSTLSYVTDPQDMFYSIYGPNQKLLDSRWTNTSFGGEQLGRGTEDFFMNWLKSQRRSEVRASESSGSKEEVFKLVIDAFRQTKGEYKASHKTKGEYKAFHRKLGEFLGDQLRPALLLFLSDSSWKKIDPDIPDEELTSDSEIEQQELESEVEGNVVDILLDISKFASVSELMELYRIPRMRKMRGMYGLLVHKMSPKDYLEQILDNPASAASSALWPSGVLFLNRELAPETRRGLIDTLIATMLGPSDNHLLNEEIYGEPLKAVAAQVLAWHLDFLIQTGAQEEKEKLAAAFTEVLKVQINKKVLEHAASALRKFEAAGVHLKGHEKAFSGSPVSDGTIKNIIRMIQQEDLQSRWAYEMSHFDTLYPGERWRISIASRMRKVAGTYDFGTKLVLDYPLSGEDPTLYFLPDESKKRVYGLEYEIEMDSYPVEVRGELGDPKSLENDFTVVVAPDRRIPLRRFLEEHMPVDLAGNQYALSRLFIVENSGVVARRIDDPAELRIYPRGNEKFLSVDFHRGTIEQAGVLKLTEETEEEEEGEGKEPWHFVFDPRFVPLDDPDIEVVLGYHFHPTRYLPIMSPLDIRSKEAEFLERDQITPELILNFNREGRLYLPKPNVDWKFAFKRLGGVSEAQKTESVFWREHDPDRLHRQAMEFEKTVRHYFDIVSIKLNVDGSILEWRRLGEEDFQEPGHQNSGLTPRAEVRVKEDGLTDDEKQKLMAIRSSIVGFEWKVEERYKSRLNIKGHLYTDRLPAFIAMTLHGLVNLPAYVNPAIYSYPNLLSARENLSLAKEVLELFIREPLNTIHSVPEPLSKEIIGNLFAVRLASGLLASSKKGELTSDHLEEIKEIKSEVEKWLLQLEAIINQVKQRDISPRAEVRMKVVYRNGVLTVSIPNEDDIQARTVAELAKGLRDLKNHYVTANSAGDSAWIMHPVTKKGDSIRINDDPNAIAAVIDSALISRAEVRSGFQGQEVFKWFERRLSPEGFQVTQPFNPEVGGKLSSVQTPKYYEYINEVVISAKEFSFISTAISKEDPSGIIREVTRSAEFGSDRTEFKVTKKIGGEITQEATFQYEGQNPVVNFGMASDRTFPSVMVNKEFFKKFGEEKAKSDSSLFDGFPINIKAEDDEGILYYELFNPVFGEFNFGERPAPANEGDLKPGDQIQTKEGKEIIILFNPTEAVALKLPPGVFVVSSKKGDLDYEVIPAFTIRSLLHSGRWIPLTQKWAPHFLHWRKDIETEVRISLGEPPRTLSEQQALLRKASKGLGLQGHGVSDESLITVREILLTGYLIHRKGDIQYAILELLGMAYGPRDNGTGLFVHLENVKREYLDPSHLEKGYRISLQENLKSLLIVFDKQYAEQMRNEFPQYADRIKSYEEAANFLKRYQARAEVRSDVEIQGPDGPIKWQVSEAASNIIQKLQWNLPIEEATNEIRTRVDVEPHLFFTEELNSETFFWSLEHVYDPSINLSMKQRDYLAKEILQPINSFPTFVLFRLFQLNEEQLEAWWYLLIKVLIIQHKLSQVSPQDELTQKHAELIQNIYRLTLGIFKDALERGFTTANLKSFFETRLYPLASSQSSLRAVIGELLQNWDTLADEYLQAQFAISESEREEEAAHELTTEHLQEMLRTVAASSKRQQWFAQQLLTLRNVLTPRSEQAIEMWDHPIEYVKKVSNRAETVFLDTSNEMNIRYETTTAELPNRWKFRLALFDQLGQIGFKRWAIISSLQYIQAFHKAYTREEERPTIQQFVDLLQQYLNNPQELPLRDHLGLPANGREAPEITGSINFWKELWELKNRYKAEVVLFGALEFAKDEDPNDSEFKRFDDWLKKTSGSKKIIVGSFPFTSFHAEGDRIGNNNDPKIKRFEQVLAEKDFQWQNFIVSGAFSHISYQIGQARGWGDNQTASFPVRGNQELSNFFQHAISPQDREEAMAAGWGDSVMSFKRDYESRFDAIVVTSESDEEGKETPWVPEDVDTGVKSPKELVPVGAPRAEVRSEESPSKKSGVLIPQWALEALRVLPGSFRNHLESQDPRQLAKELKSYLSLPKNRKRLLQASQFVEDAFGPAKEGEIVTIPSLQEVPHLAVNEPSRALARLLFEALLDPFLAKLHAQFTERRQSLKLALLLATKTALGPLTGPMAEFAAKELLGPGNPWLEFAGIFAGAPSRLVQLEYQADQFRELSNLQDIPPDMLDTGLDLIHGKIRAALDDQFHGRIFGRTLEESIPLADAQRRLGQVYEKLEGTQKTLSKRHPSFGIERLEVLIKSPLKFAPSLHFQARELAFNWHGVLHNRPQGVELVAKTLEDRFNENPELAKEAVKQFMYASDSPGDPARQRFLDVLDRLPEAVREQVETPKIQALRQDRQREQELRLENLKKELTKVNRTLARIKDIDSRIWSVGEKVWSVTPEQRELFHRKGKFEKKRTELETNIQAIETFIGINESRRAEARINLDDNARLDKHRFGEEAYEIYKHHDSESAISIAKLAEESGYSFAELVAEVLRGFTFSATLNSTEAQVLSHIYQILREVKPGLKTELEKDVDVKKIFAASKTEGYGVEGMRQVPLDALQLSSSSVASQVIKILDFAFTELPNAAAQEFVKKLGQYKAIELLEKEDRGVLTQTYATVRFVDDENLGVNRFPFVELGSGSNATEYPIYLPKTSRRQVHLVDHSLFMEALLNETILRTAENPDQFQVLREDVLGLDRFYQPKRIGTLMMRSLGQYVQPLSDWYGRMEQLIVPGGKIIIALRPRESEPRDIDQDRLLDELKDEHLGEIHSDHVLVKSFLSTLIGSNEPWKFRFGHIDAQGNFVEGKTGYRGKGHYSETFLIFEKLYRAEMRAYEEVWKLFEQDGLLKRKDLLQALDEAVSSAIGQRDKREMEGLGQDIDSLRSEIQKEEIAFSPQDKQARVVLDKFSDLLNNSLFHELVKQLFPDPNHILRRFIAAALARSEVRKQIESPKLDDYFKVYGISKENVIAAAAEVAKQTISDVHRLQPEIFEALLNAVVPAIAENANPVLDQSILRAKLEESANFIARLVAQEIISVQGEGIAVMTTAANPEDVQKREALVLAAVSMFVRLVPPNQKDEYVQFLVFAGPLTKAIKDAIFTRDNGLTENQKGIAGRIIGFASPHDPILQTIQTQVKQHKGVVSSLANTDMEEMPKIIQGVLLHAVEDLSELKNVTVSSEKLAQAAEAYVVRALILRDLAEKLQAAKLKDQAAEIFIRNYLVKMNVEFSFENNTLTLTLAAVTELLNTLKTEKATSIAA